MARNVEFDEEVAIQKAMEVFSEKGYNGTSLRDLTDAMKINSSSLYNTIGDKQELFVRCVKHYTEIRKRDLQRRATSAESPFTILVNYIHDAVAEIVSGTESCMTVKAAFEVATNDQRIKDILKEDSEYSYQFICSHISKAMEKGEISSEEDPQLLADYFISTWTGWNESYILYKDPVKIQRMANYFIKQLSK
ncbi:TetR/AcrR family transcriptional regulator [Xanthocytophaga agilis]|uniref:TetR/AcrR family transcriptional regulator n=1 Tax=Xanthocytophaga agilis TaxID=3048010 RepID=A0AAE3UGM8_9BACT|nr:TetR/AcrR family transcriptional regulator [Xanthocytophaga agilis]MDJ1501753.1 TetR/AcrR family transcriptional regulator [Xanthocytophaga agilis]